MQDVTNTVFDGLFRAAYSKCFGEPLQWPLSETAAKHFGNTIFDATGLVIGAKSLKNYAAYLLNPQPAKPEKPSVATLDTLARYVLGAPYTDERERKNKEGHFPYWFQYRNSHNNSAAVQPPITSRSKNMGSKVFWLPAAVLVLLVLIMVYGLPAKNSSSFTDNFHTVAEDTLTQHGWFVQHKDERWWQQRSQLQGCLTLYTLQGDNWADSAHTAGIPNLLLRRCTPGCFTAELHLDHFMPAKQWQQAGIIFLEDTLFAGKSLRLSIAYNDFFGGYSKPKEIILQAISSDGTALQNPEEIIHLPLFSIEKGQDSMVAGNLQKSALRIEKNGKHFRILYATGSSGNFAFKEALSKDLNIQPAFIGIFALQGFVHDTVYAPAHVSFFSMHGIPCSKE